jgi:glycosyltransferase involved in cell wall biosynthesis
MNIGINLIRFLPGKMGGVETYVRNLISNLQEYNSNCRFVLLCDKKNFAQFNLYDPSFSFEEINFPKHSFRWFVRGIIKKSFHIDLLSPVFAKMDLDVIHHPFSFLEPSNLKTPSVVTFIDMQHEFYPHLFTQKALNWRKVNYKRSVEEATRVISISEYTKHCLIDRYSIDPCKIDVVHLGYGKEHHVIEDTDHLGVIKSKYGLHSPFLYYPAATWPHKNHIRLLKALKIIKDQYSFDGELVLSGIAKQMHPMILAEIKSLNLSGTVKVLGYLPEDELPYLYNLARLMVFPSLFEGFGIPLVEAMACGCPIVCSNVTSIPEVVGDAAVMFSPDSVEDMAEKIWALWNNDEQLQIMKQSGLRRVQLFSCEEMARKTLDVYAKIT